MKRLFLTIILLGTIVSTSCAENQSVSKVKDLEIVKSFLSTSNTQLKEVRDIGSLFELTVEQGKKKGIIYVTKDGKYLVFGSLFDKDRNNITKARQDEINVVDFSKLPLQDAIMIKKGNGNKKLVMITDVDCPFCKKAHAWLKEKTDYTLYVFLFPLSIHPEAHAKSVKILCSDNPATSLDIVKSGQEIKNEKCDSGENKLKQHMAVAGELGVSGTPLFITENGKRIDGFNQQALEEYLKK
ncbi:MAG: DsbC family protein [Thermodesulfovibrionales bacterium]|nr:DsbC family protein [Thermodesulfovibrionales bacterium]